MKYLGMFLLGNKGIEMEGVDERADFGRWRGDRGMERLLQEHQATKVTENEEEDDDDDDEEFDEEDLQWELKRKR